MKNEIAISLVLYNKKYIRNFFKYTFKSIISEKNFANKKYKYLLISTLPGDKDNIIKEYKKFKECKFQIKFFLIKNVKDKYKIVTNEQINHISFAKKEKINFLFFAYADMLFSKKYFEKSIKLIKSKKKIAILTFALLVNKNKFFKKFFNHIISKNNDHLIYLLKNKKLIHPYHQSFEVTKKNANFSRSFMYTLDKQNIVLKAFHFHPIVINLNMIKQNKINNLRDIITLDNKFLHKISNNSRQLLVAKDLKKISCFSFDNNSYSRTNASYKILNLIKRSSNTNLKNNEMSNYIHQKLDILFFKFSSQNVSELEKELFIKNTLYFKREFKNHHREYLNEFVKTAKEVKNKKKNQKISEFIDEIDRIYFKHVKRIFPIYITNLITMCFSFLIFLLLQTRFMRIFNFSPWKNFTQSLFNKSGPMIIKSYIISKYIYYYFNIAQSNKYFLNKFKKHLFKKSIN